MAISKNMWLKGASQRLGGVVLYQAKGETRMRELAPSVSNPRTEGQMTQRVKLANLVNFYRTSKGWMQRAFEVKPNNNSDYNRFVSLNLTGNNIYLTKQEANAGACIVDAYRVTEGTLPSIEVYEDVGNWMTNIFTGDLNSIDENTTVSTFATALLGANPGIKQGDQISFIRLSQQTNPNTGIPYMIVRAYEVLMDIANTAPLANYLPIGYFDIGTFNGNNALKVVNSGLAGGFVLILSRTLGSTIAVSTQDVIVANNDALINSHSSEAAKQTAIESYGQGEEVFLSSSTAGSIGQQVVPLALLSADIGGDIYVSGDVGPTLEDLQEAPINLIFNAEVPTGNYQVVLQYYTGNGGITTWQTLQGQASGTAISFSGPTPTAALLNKVLAKIEVTISGVTYNITLLDGSLG